MEKYDKIGAAQEGLGWVCERIGVRRWCVTDSAWILASVFL